MFDSFVLHVKKNVSHIEILLLFHWCHIYHFNQTFPKISHIILGQVHHKNGKKIDKKNKQLSKDE